MGIDDDDDDDDDCGGVDDDDDDDDDDDGGNNDTISNHNLVTHDSRNCPNDVRFRRHTFWHIYGVSISGTNIYFVRFSFSVVFLFKPFHFAIVVSTLTVWYHYHHHHHRH